MCAHNPEGQLYPGLHQEKSKVRGGYSALLLHSGEAPPGSPVSSSGALRTGKMWTSCIGSRGDTSNDPKAGTLLLGGKAGRAGAVQPGEAKSPGRPPSSLPVPEGACERAGEGLLTRVWSDRTKGNGFKLKEGKLRICIRM